MQGARVTVGTAPVQLAVGFGGLEGSLSYLVKNLDTAATIDIGGPGVTSGAGYPLGPGASLSADLISGNQLWAVAASGTVSVAVLGES